MALLLLLIGLPLYFLPAILGRKKRNFEAIFGVNLLLGWTFLGWVVALVWALTVDAPPAAAPSEETPSPALADQLARLSELRAQGVLSEEEFERAKGRLIG